MQADHSASAYADAAELSAADNTEQLTEIGSLNAFFAEGKIAQVLRVVKSGKEATVYCCLAGPATPYEFVAAKVYRSRTQRAFKNDAVYWHGRSVGKRREQLAFAKKTGVGREVQAKAWVQREWETLRLLHGAGADVPAPLGATSGAILMEYLGDAEAAAPLLQHTCLTPDEVQPAFEQLMRNVALWLAHHRVHGDLSPFNVLYWAGAVKAIDFPQAVDPRQNRNAPDLLRRDLENLCRYFARYGLQVDGAWLAADLWSQYVRR